MRKSIRSFVMGVLVAAGLALAPAAFARSHWNVGIGIGLPGISIGYSDCRHCGRGWGGNYYYGGGYYGGYSSYYAPAYYGPTYYSPSYYDAGYYGPSYYYPSYGVRYYDRPSHRYYGNGYRDHGYRDGGYRHHDRGDYGHRASYYDRDGYRH
jgi:hypothetical protein